MPSSSGLPSSHLRWPKNSRLVAIGIPQPIAQRHMPGCRLRLPCQPQEPHELGDSVARPHVVLLPAPALKPRNLVDDDALRFRQLAAELGFQRAEHLPVTLAIEAAGRIAGLAFPELGGDLVCGLYICLHGESYIAMRGRD